MANKLRSNDFFKKLYAFLDYLWRLVVLNFLIVIPAFLPVIIYTYINKETSPSDLALYLTFIPTLLYFFPAVVATADVIRMYEDNLTKGVFKEFFKSLKKHYFKSLIISIFIFVFIALLTFQIKFSNGMTIFGPLLYFYENIEMDIIYLFGFFLTIAFVLIVILLIIHLPLVMIYFEGLSIWQYLKLSCIMAFKQIGVTLLLLLIIVVIGSLDIAYYFIMLLGGISLPIYFMVKLSFKQYIKIYKKVGEKKNVNEKDR